MKNKYYYVYLYEWRSFDVDDEGYEWYKTWRCESMEEAISKIYDDVMKKLKRRNVHIFEHLSGKYNEHYRYDFIYEMPICRFEASNKKGYMDIMYTIKTPDHNDDNLEDIMMKMRNEP